MNEQRKRMIITEIKYWKKNKLLPEHYCDFLITLYAQGEEEHATNIKGSVPVLIKEKNSFSRFVIIISLLTFAVSSSMFIFVQYPIVTLTLTAAVVAGLLFLTLRKTISQSIVQFIYILSSFMLLAMSLKIWLTFFEGHTMLLIGFLLLNCGLWLLAGRLLKLLYFTISGTVGLLLIIGFLFISLKVF